MEEQEQQDPALKQEVDFLLYISIFLADQTLYDLLQATVLIDNKICIFII